MFEIPVAPVHAGVKIGVSFADFVDIALCLVLHGPRLVLRFEPFVGRPEIYAVTGLIAQ